MLTLQIILAVLGVAIICYLLLFHLERFLEFTG